MSGERAFNEGEFEEVPDRCDLCLKNDAYTEVGDLALCRSCFENKMQAEISDVDFETDAYCGFCGSKMKLSAVNWDIDRPSIVTYTCPNCGYKIETEATE